jgi:hypothetical protein
MHLLTDPTAVGFFYLRSNGSDLSHLAHSSTTSWMWKYQQSKCSYRPWGYTIPISSLFMKIEGKGARYVMPLFSFVNLIFVSDPGSSDGISSIDSLLIPMLLPQNFKRIIPPRTRLLRLAHSSPFSKFLVNLPKEGISVKRSIPGHPWRQIRGKNFPRTGWKSDLVQLKNN